MLSTREGLHPARRRATLARTLSRLGAAGAIAASLQLAAPAAAQVRTDAPKALSDAEFWDFFITMSEAGGSFPSENFVSNETSFQEVIPTLQRSLTRGGVYLGVGPEQNFTYIANIKPRMAVIFDIRRQNAMHHLMYKAIFEQSPSRADFIERLFSRPMARLGPAAPARELFDTATAAAPSDSAYGANLKAIMSALTETHGFALSPDDIMSIQHVYRVFYEAGPNVNYGYRPGMPAVFAPTYPTFGMLQSATTLDSVQMAFLASEENYRAVRDLHLANLIVPVVGDFAGPKAIRAVGEYLKKGNMTVTAFYLSNVEQYLFRQPNAADRFYGNVAALPTDSTSTLIRSVPRSDGSMFSLNAAGVGPGGVWTSALRPGLVFTVTRFDSAGSRFTRTVRDSAGTLVVVTERAVRPTVDSTTGRVRTISVVPMPLAPGRTVTRPADSTQVSALLRDSLLLSSLRLLARRDSTFRTPILGGVPAGRPTTVMMRGGVLSSGLVTVHETLAAFFAGRLTTYADAIAMTKTSGWK